MSSLAKARAWTKVTFGDVVRQVKDRVDPEASGLERYVAGEHMDTDDLRIRRWGEIGDGYLGPAFHMRFKPGHILYGSRRTYLRKVAVADFAGITANTTYVLESKDPNVLLPELLPFIMQTDSFNRHSVRESKGSVNPYVNFSDLAWFEFALPPIPEQRRFAEAIKAVDRVNENLVQSAGRCFSTWVPLVRHWTGLESAAEELAVIQGDRRITRTGLEVLRVADICSTNRQGVQVGPFGGSVSSRHFALAGVPVLKINNINNLGELELDDLVYLNGEQAGSLSERYSVEPGDLLTAAQATIGRTAIADERVRGAIISQHIIRISPNPDLCLPTWLHALFSSPLVLRQMHMTVQGGTRAGLNTTDVENIRVPIPSLPEQERFSLDLKSIRSAHRGIMKRAGGLRDLRRLLLGAIGGC